MASPSATHKGWHFDRVNGRLQAVYNGTEVLDFDGNDLTVAQSLATVGITSASGGIAATTGNITAVAGDLRVTAGNARLGAVSAFATTEPTSWIVFKAGTQPSGAITTSGGLGANATTVQKIVAGGTINNVET